MKLTTLEVLNTACIGRCIFSVTDTHF